MAPPSWSLRSNHKLMIRNAPFISYFSFKVEGTKNFICLSYEKCKLMFIIKSEVSVMVYIMLKFTKFQGLLLLKLMPMFYDIGQ